MNGGKITILLVAAASALAPFSASGAEPKPDNTLLTAREAFVNLPLEVMDLLPKSTRLDMLDYFEADSVWQAKNTLGGPSVLEQLSDNRLTVKLTPVSRLQVCILPSVKKNEGPVVMTLYTVGDDAPDTELNFFSREMAPLEEKKFFKAPKLRDFFNVDRRSGRSEKELEQIVAFPTVEYEMEQGGRLVGRLTVSPLLSQEDREALDKYLRKDLRWEWKGKFERIK